MNIQKDVYEWLKMAGIEYQDTFEQRKLGLDLVEEEKEELVLAVLVKDKQGIIDACVDLFWVVTNNLIFNNISLEEFEEYAQKVSYSNWSKFCISEDDANATVKAYMEGTHPAKPGHQIECYWKQVGKLYVIYRTVDNKIMKSIYYETPQQVNYNNKEDENS